MTHHEHRRLDDTLSWVRGHNTNRNRVTLLVVLFVLFGIAVGLLTLNDSWERARNAKRDRQQQQCLVQLQKLITQRNAALVQVGNDDRDAQRALNARWARDVITGNFRDIPRAYEVFRQQSIKNDRRRDALGSGVSVSDACDFHVIIGNNSPVPSLNPRTGSTATTSTSLLPRLPSVVTRTVQRTTTRTLSAQVRFVDVPGPVITATVTQVPAPLHVPTRTVTTHVTRTIGRPGPTRTIITTRTRTVTITICISVPVLPSPSCVA